MSRGGRRKGRGAESVDINMIRGLKVILGFELRTGTLTLFESILELMDHYERSAPFERTRKKNKHSNKTAVVH